MAGAPVAFTHVTRKMLDTANVQDLGPERWELRFGDGALESLGREVRRITSIEQAWGLPLTLPEEPGPLADAVEVVLVCAAGGVRQFISALMLARSL